MRTMRYGYFDNQNREYVIERPDIPVSWTNYLGVKDLCTVISQNTGGYSFYKSAEHRRITRFRQNAVPLDRPGHYVYLRDDDSEDYWSVSWQPVGKNLNQAVYHCHHGLSYSRFICDYNDIYAEQRLFIPVNEDVELWDLRLKNNGSKVRQLSIFPYLEFSFHHVEMDNQNLQMSLYATGADYQEGIIEYDLYYEPEEYYYFASSFRPDSYDTVREKFLGNYRTESNPRAVERGECHNSVELGGNHCACLHKRLNLSPGEETRLIFMLGAGRREAGKKIKEKYSQAAKVDRAFLNLREYWEGKLAAFQCQTPHQGLDTMLNTWNLYQAETCVNWSRFASFIEVGGRTGLGYRDTAQDVMAVSHSNPEMSRQRLLELLRGLTSQGYGIHLFEPEWFDPEEKKKGKFKSPTVVPERKPDNIIHGMEEACSDDALWLVPAVCDYIKESGELEFFDEMVSYADGGQATVYEHLKRILDFSAEQLGPNGICKGLRADWNDCLNLGGEESALVSFLHHHALLVFIEAAAYLGREGDVGQYRKLAREVKIGRAS